MGKYVLDHHLEGERSRLALMSQLLDPMHRRYIESLGVGQGARALEVGCGNGSISAWLAERVGPRGRVVAVDLDLSLVEVRVAQAPAATGRHRRRLCRSRRLRSRDRPGGAASRHGRRSGDPEPRRQPGAGGSILLIEPDFLPVSVAEPPEVRAFWNGWLAWSRDQGIDYHIGRTLAQRLAAASLDQVAGTAETAVYNGGSPWADYWTQTVTELRDQLVDSGSLDDQLIDRFVAYCADPALVDADHRLHGRSRPRSPRLSGRAQQERFPFPRRRAGRGGSQGG